MAGNYIIYVHKNKINNKCYIGQTCQSPMKRWGHNGIGYKRSPKFYNENVRPVKCLNTGEIFPSVGYCAAWCGLKNTSGIRRVCVGERLTAGIHPDTEEKLKWVFLEKGVLVSRYKI